MEALRNPSEPEVAEMLRSGSLRVARDHANGDIYVWQGAVATHRQMIERLQLPMADGAGWIHEISDYRAIAARAR